MKCPKCGKEGTQNFCEYCGTKLSENNNEKNDNMKIIASIFFGIALILIISGLILIYIEKSTQKQTQYVGQAIPEKNITSAADKTEYEIKRKTTNNEPETDLLNDHLQELNVELKKYLVSIGNIVSKNWVKNNISGTGTCTIEITIDSNGMINKKEIVEQSSNQALNNSVQDLLEKINDVGTPPEAYKGERIRISLDVKNNKFKLFYPNK